MSQTACPASAMGNFSLLPSEIIFKILDDIMWSTPTLVHENFCAINQLMKTNKQFYAFIKTGWLGKKSFSYLKDSVNALEWYQDAEHAWETLQARGIDSSNVMPIEGHPDCELDLITGIIFDDCPECFEWLAENLPPALMSCCNAGGWSFLSLAMHAKSEKILDRLFQAGYPHEPSDFISGRANAMLADPSNIGVAASSKDHRSFTKLFLTLRELLHGRGFNRTIRDRLSKSEKVAIRSVAPPELQKLLYNAGMMVLYPYLRNGPNFTTEGNETTESSHDS
ncbi:hypothetical protein N7457_003330 [Penicillium paradoxum]|uniref:uncharacterized protein n=1 Tax=Penicillium paradoxum TaxID=176176 RepID=UPI0025477B81|nr:uncharacterized protein N7457_003330 [Penicillium paradoxum]KAJ5788340.1 hypothetical protein N7457_003330 [Penicillium paradoxum]